MRAGRKTSFIAFGLVVLVSASAGVVLFGSSDLRAGYLLWLAATLLTSSSVAGIFGAQWFAGRAMRRRSGARDRLGSAALSAACLAAAGGCGWLLDALVRSL